MRRPGYYPPEWSIFLLADTTFPWLQVDQGKKLEERSSRPKASSEVLQDCIHTISINLLDGLSKSPGEVPDGFVVPLEDRLERDDVSFLPNGAHILRDKCDP